MIAGRTNGGIFVKTICAYALCETVPQNVLLIVLDSVRTKNTSLHGYSRDTTPFLSEFSNRATVFSQARAPSVASLPSHVSMFTGYHAAEHGMGNDSHHNGVRLQDDVTIWEKLATEHGYRTGIFSNNPYLTAVPVGIRDAFDTVVGQTEPPFPDAVDPRSYYDGDINYADWARDCLLSGKVLRSVINGISLKASRSDNSVYGLPQRLEPNGYADIFLDWIDDISGDNWAACINLMDAHTPYTPAPQYDKWSTEEDWEIQSTIDHFRWEFVGRQRPLAELENLKNLYDGAIHQADSKVQRIISGLERRGLLEDTLIVITSDHGEGFGEPSQIRPNQHAIGHSFGLHESQTHVPLIVRFPRRTDTEQGRYRELASLTYFPSVVMNSIEENTEPAKELLSDSGVLSTQLPLGSKDIQLAATHGIKSKHITGAIRAAYEKREQVNYKYMSWGEKYGKFKLSEEENVIQVADGNARKRLNQLYNLCREVDIINRDEKKNTEQRVQERLEQLGYI